MANELKTQGTALYFVKPGTPTGTAVKVTQRPQLAQMDVSFAEHVHEERQHAAWLIVLESRLSWPTGLAR